MKEHLKHVVYEKRKWNDVSLVSTLENMTLH